MSMFGSIMSKIFGHPANAATPAAEAAPSAAPAPEAAPAPASSPVDVEAVLTAMASKNPQTLNWQQSIVDLLKLLDLDSSLGARKTLATELHYTGDENDSAAMNIWLHKAVMQKLSENGGTVPDSLKGCSQTRRKWRRRRCRSHGATGTDHAFLSESGLWTACLPDLSLFTSTSGFSGVAFAVWPFIVVGFVTIFSTTPFVSP